MKITRIKRFILAVIAGTMLSAEVMATTSTYACPSCANRNFDGSVSVTDWGTPQESWDWSKLVFAEVELTPLYFSYGLFLRLNDDTPHDDTLKTLWANGDFWDFDHTFYFSSLASLDGEIWRVEPNLDLRYTSPYLFLAHEGSRVAKFELVAPGAVAVPIPAAAFMFAPAALLGFLAFRRRKMQA
jgi:hypothetical protein